MKDNSSRWPKMMDSTSKTKINIGRKKNIAHHNSIVRGSNRPELLGKHFILREKKTRKGRE